MSDTPTAEEIAQHYSACMDSVNLINAVAANPSDYSNDPTVVHRNVKHLEGMVNYPHWTDEDMPLVSTMQCLPNCKLASLFTR